MNAPLSLSMPAFAVGAPIPRMPGFVYAGQMRGEADAPGWHIAALIDHKAANIAEIRGQWGEYGKSIKGATQRRDGLANTQAMAEAGNPIAKAALDADVYIASLAEAQLISANLNDLMPKGWHFTSTQYSPSSAWVQGFEYGRSLVDYKDGEFRAVAVRRFNPSDFGTSPEQA